MSGLLSIFEETVQLVLNEWFSVFFNPQKRIFWGYLLSSLLIGTFWLKFSNKTSIRNSFTKIFARDIWISKSARADYKVMIINSGIMIVLSPNLLAKATVAYFFFDGMNSFFDGRPFLEIDVPSWLIALSFTLFLFIIDDFAKYWLHRWLHKIPFFWSFHKVHHSATSLNPFTVFRTHPLEAILFSIRSTIVQGITTAVFFFFFGNQVNLVIVMGASIFTFTFNILGANLRHSSVSIKYWKPLEYILMSPAQHHIHHSNANCHINKNFGVALSFWDWIFDTLNLSHKIENLNFGLNENFSSSHHSLRGLYVDPIIEAKKIALINLSNNFEQIKNTLKIQKEQI